MPIVATPNQVRHVYMIRIQKGLFKCPHQGGCEMAVRWVSSHEQGAAAYSLVKTTAAKKRNYHKGGSLEGRNRRSRSGKPVFAQSRREAVCVGASLPSTFARPEGHTLVEAGAHVDLVTGVQVSACLFCFPISFCHASHTAQVHGQKGVQLSPGGAQKDSLRQAVGGRDPGARKVGNRWKIPGQALDEVGQPAGATA